MTGRYAIITPDYPVSPNVLRALKQACPFCEAGPDQWCVTAGGRIHKYLHAYRFRGLLAKSTRYTRASDDDDTEDPAEGWHEATGEH